VGVPPYQVRCECAAQAFSVQLPKRIVAVQLELQSPCDIFELRVSKPQHGPQGDAIGV
jgi:hypothetical protein